MTPKDDYLKTINLEQILRVIKSLFLGYFASLVD